MQSTSDYTCIALGTGIYIYISDSAQAMILNQLLMILSHLHVRKRPQTQMTEIHQRSYFM